MCFQCYFLIAVLSVIFCFRKVKDSQNTFKMSWGDASLTRKMPSCFKTWNMNSSFLPNFSITHSMTVCTDVIWLRNYKKTMVEKIYIHEHPINDSVLNIFMPADFFTMFLPDTFNSSLSSGFIFSIAWATVHSRTSSISCSKYMRLRNNLSRGDSKFLKNVFKQFKKPQNLQQSETKNSTKMQWHCIFAMSERK